jgi:RecA-family ATPase
MTADNTGPGFDVEPLGPPGVLDEVWRPLGEWPHQEPPRRRWLVTQSYEGETHPRGVLPMGKVCLMAGAGGAGKSYLAMQLAVAVASGARWIGCDVETPGRVLLVLGEEEAEEARRRLHHVGRMLGLTAAQQEAASRNLVVLPMAGRDVALTGSLEDVKPGGGLPTTPLFEEFERRMADGDEWRLVVLDPLSRFAGADVETDNAAATRFVQVLERLAQAPGGPTVLVTHHTTKTARREGTGGSDAAAATALRGSSALTDGVRWQANLEGLPRFHGAPRLSELRVVKTNYGPPLDAFTLVAPEGGHGALRVAWPAEVEAWRQAKKRAEAEKKAAEKGESAKETAGKARGAKARNEDEVDCFA